MIVIKHIFYILKNKYLVSLLIFAIIILFIDHNNLFEQISRKRHLNEMLASKNFYEQQIEKTKKELSDLQYNSATIEKYARENFYMKKDNEDIFIIENSIQASK